MKKVAIYARVSTLEQAESGYSISEQVSKLEKYSEIKDYKIYDTYIDPGYSGSNLERPQMRRLIDDAKLHRFDIVLVYKLDRISRSQRDTLYLIEEIFNKNNIAFTSLNENLDTSTAFGKAMIGILSVFAQLEREQITERMQMGKLGRAKSGKAMGWTRVPFGYTYNPETQIYDIEPFEAEIVKRIFREYLAGQSITKLRNTLNSEGLTGQKKKWAYKTIHDILDQPVYTGMNKYRGKLFEGSHAPIIDKQMFDEVQAELQKRQVEAFKASNNPRPFQSKYLLSGFIRCGYCGAPLEVSISTLKDGSKRYRYKCKNRAHHNIYAHDHPGIERCTSKSYLMEDLERVVLEEIEKLQLNPSLVKGKSLHKGEINTEAVQARIALLNKKLTKLSDLYVNDMISMDGLKDQSEPIKEEIKQLENKLQAEKEKPEVSKAVDWIKNNQILINSLDYETQKIIVRMLIERISVTAEKVKIFWRF